MLGLYVTKLRTWVTRLRGDSWDRTYATINIVLHVFLVVLHILLLVSLRYRFENHISVDPEGAVGILSQSATVITQIFATLFTGVLVMMTQTLALRRDFHDEVTLTALHDKASAWLGLMASVNVLLSQFRLRTAVLPVLLTICYLAGITILHITTPILFSVTNKLRPFTAADWAWWNADTNATVVPARFLPDKEVLTIDFIYRSLPIILPLPNIPVSAYALNESVLFDIPTADFIRDDPHFDAKVEGDIETGMIAFEYSCGVVREAVVSNSTRDGSITIDMAPAFGSVTVSLLDEEFPISMVQAPPPLSNSNGTTPNLPWILVAGVEDNNLDVEIPRLSLPVPIVYPDLNTTLPFAFVLACPLVIKKGIVVNRHPYKLAPNITQEELSLFVRSNRPNSSGVSYYNSSEDRSGDELVEWLGSMMPSSTPRLENGQCKGQNGTLFEGAVCVQYPQILRSILSDCSPPEDSDGVFDSLNMCLGEQAALLAWIGGKYSQSEPYYFPQINWWARRACLNLNPLPVQIGLATSIGLLILSFLLTWPHQRRTTLNRALESPGILQIAWLLGRAPQYARAVAEEKNPDLQSLRKVGNFPFSVLKHVDGDPASTALLPLNEGGGRQK